MRIMRYLLLALFFTYVAVFTTLPLAILWDWTGLVLGISLSLLFLSSLYFRGERRIFGQLHLRKITRAESPELHHIVLEYSRRLDLPPPKLAVLETDALNIGVFGFTKKQMTLVLTRGLLQNFTRTQISALIGRELCAIWYGDVVLSTWLCRFLNFIEWAAGYRTKTRTHLHTKQRAYPLNSLLRQLVLLPLAIFPRYVLLKIRQLRDLDLTSVKMTKLPHELAESYRMIDALSPRLAFRTPFCTGHLFLIRPVPADPLARALFRDSDLSLQTAKLSSLRHVVELR